MPYLSSSINVRKVIAYRGVTRGHADLHLNGQTKRQQKKKIINKKTLYSDWLGIVDIYPNCALNTKHQAVLS